MPSQPILILISANKSRQSGEWTSDFLDAVIKPLRRRRAGAADLPPLSQGKPRSPPNPQMRRRPGGGVAPPLVRGPAVSRLRHVAPSAKHKEEPCPSCWPER